MVIEGGKQTNSSVAPFFIFLFFFSFTLALVNATCHNRS